MKITKIDSSVPSHHDFIITYQGEIASSSTEKRYRVTTLILNLPMAIIQAYPSSSSRESVIKTIYPTLSKDSNNRYYFDFNIPANHTCSYIITGSEKKATFTHHEVSEISIGTNSWLTKEHTHDGIDSNTLEPISALQTDESNAGKLLAVNATGDFVYIAVPGITTLGDFELLKIEGVNVSGNISDPQQILLSAFSSITVDWEDCTDAVKYYCIAYRQTGGKFIAIKMETITGSPPAPTVDMVMNTGIIPALAEDDLLRFDVIAESVAGIQKPAGKSAYVIITDTPS